MTISIIMYDLIKASLPDHPVGKIFFDHIPQATILNDTDGIVLIKEITLDAKSSKDLVSNTKTMESIYRVEIIGDIESYMALETVANTLTDALVGYHDSTIKVIDLSLGHQDGNDEAKIKRFIRDFQIIHI